MFIRSYARLTGTKFMCLEGGCGACIVNVSGIRTPSGDARTIAINSVMVFFLYALNFFPMVSIKKPSQMFKYVQCLWPVYACDGLTVTTVEGIGNLKDGYHPIQKALYHFNGTQCGYCSPGWVMNMYSLLDSSHGKVSMQQVENAFGGNICRCTGYRPILDAFKSLASNSCSSDIEDLTLDLCRLKQPNATSPCSFQRICKRTCTFQPLRDDELVADDGKMWLRPKNLADLLKILTTQTMKAEYMLVAGNTAHGMRTFENLKFFLFVQRKLVWSGSI